LKRGTILGRVVLPSGTPVGEAAVMLGGNSPAHADIALLSAADGAFELRDLGPGSYTVLASCEWGAGEGRVLVEAGRVTRLEIVVR
jgi:hypothetical protein